MTSTGSGRQSCKRSKARLPTLLRDALGILFLAGILYLSLSLFSYHPNDPSFSRHLDPTPPVQNLGGYLGAYLADVWISLFGSGAYLLLVVLLLNGWALLKGRLFGRAPWLILLGGALFLLSVCGLLNLTFRDELFFPSQPLSGGVLGQLIASYLSKILNIAGAYLALSTLFFLSLLMVSPLSLSRFSQSSGDIFRRLSTGNTSSSSKLEKRKTKKGLLKEPPNRESSMTDEDTLSSENGLSSPARIGEAGNTPFFTTRPDQSTQESQGYQLPPLTLLDSPPNHARLVIDEKVLRAKGEFLEGRLKDFGIHGKVTHILQGPVITTYEFEPASGVKVSRIMSLSDDLALAMKALSVRILAPVPRKAVVGIEIPHDQRETVCLREIISSQTFQESRSKLTLALGKDILGNPVVTDLAQIPHLLIAGATGAGKSVGLNSMICSLLFNATPEEVRLIMIDPKMLELSIYDGIPHLISPVVTDPKKASAALKWAVGEMESRYKLMSEKGVRNIQRYNQWVDEQGTAPPLDPISFDEASESIRPERKLHYVVVVIDELADLMMVSSKDVEDSLARLAQMARAAGIHLLVATQRPSVDVLTGVIKANFPSRLSFQVSSRVDSRTILDSIGAERLLGKGDMLFLPPGISRLQRVHGAFVSEKEIKRLVDFLMLQRAPVYDDSVLQDRKREGDREEAEEDPDEKYEEAVQLVAQTRQASISMIQRRLRIGYNRAARIIELMEKEGLVGSSDGSKPREVYVKKEDLF